MSWSASGSATREGVTVGGGDPWALKAPAFVDSVISLDTKSMRAQVVFSDFVSPRA